MATVISETPPKYRGRGVIGRDSLPYTFADLQFHVRRFLSVANMTPEQVFETMWKAGHDWERILNFTIAQTAEQQDQQKLGSETDIKTAIEMDRKGIKGPRGRKKSAAAAGGKPEPKYKVGQQVLIPRGAMESHLVGRPEKITSVELLDGKYCYKVQGVNGVQFFEENIGLATKKTKSATAGSK